MAFEFRKKESVRKAVKRLGRREINKALRALEHCDQLEPVHEVRTDIKRLRALLRLVRPALRRADYRRCSNTLRKAAGCLAPARDAHVKVNALGELIRHFTRQLPPCPFPRITLILAEDCRNERARLSKERLPGNVTCLLKKFSKGIASARIKGSGWAAIGPGVKRTYHDGRRAYRLARENGTPERFHEWRKRAKDLLYQAELLAPIWPEQIAALETELKDLAACLGDDHDLFVLTEPTAMKRFSARAQQEAGALQALVEQRRGKLRAQALSLGARSYREKPSLLCKRLGQFWKKWRRAQPGEGFRQKNP
jgi:CHAD domain-containing protein